MEFTNLQQSEVTLIGNGNNVMQYPIPPELQQGLRTKRVGIQNLEIDASSFPRFVPLLAHFNTNSKNYLAGSTNDSSASYNDFDSNMTEHFFVIRKNDNTRACTSWVLWSNPNNIQEPFLGNLSNRSMYLQEYFYCYNFMDFLDMCQTALVVGFTDVLGVAPTTNPIFIYDAESKVFELSIPLDLTADWNVEMSQSLKNIFNFQTIKINTGYNSVTNLPISTYQVLYTQIGIQEQFLRSVCKVSNTVYPFDLFFIEVNLPFNRIIFNKSGNSMEQVDLQKRVLRQWRKQYNAIEREEIISIDTEDITDKLKPMINDAIQDNYLQFTLWVRARNPQEYIEWPLPVGQTIKFLLNTYSIF